MTPISNCKAMWLLPGAWRENSFRQRALRRQRADQRSTTVENVKLVVHNEKVGHPPPLPLESLRIRVKIQLGPWRKGLLWYGTCAPDSGGDYLFGNPTAEPQERVVPPEFSRTKAIYDGLETDGIAQAGDFQTVTETNYRDFDFRDNPLSPNLKLPILVARS